MNLQETQSGSNIENLLRSENDKLKEAADQVMKLNSGMAKAIEFYKLVLNSSRQSNDYLRTERDQYKRENVDLLRKIEKKKNKIAKLKKKILENQL